MTETDLPFPIHGPLLPIPRLSGRSTPDHLELNRDFIRQCHQDEWALCDIAAALGFTGPMTRIYALFGNYEMGRKHFGFPRLVGPAQTLSKSKSDFRRKVRFDDGGSVITRCKANAALIREMHKASYRPADMADVLGVNTGSLEGNLSMLGLNRTALGLRPLNRVNRAVKKTIGERLWTPQEDALIRRGHACTFPLSAVAGQCRRTALDVSKRAKALGLGRWPDVSDAKTRRLKAMKYDREHDVSVLDSAPPLSPRPFGLRPDAAYAK